MQIGIAYTMISLGMYTDSNWYKGMVELFNFDENDIKIMLNIKFNISVLNVANNNHSKEQDYTNKPW